MTSLDELLWSWSVWRRRRLLLAALLAAALYLNADDIGPNVAVAYFAALAGVLPILLLAAFIHGRDIVTASATRLAEEERFLSESRSAIDRSKFEHALLGLGVMQQMPTEWARKIEDLDALRTRIDDADDDLEKYERDLQGFGERWAALLVCAGEVAVVGEAAALVPLATPTPTLAPALLGGVAAAAVLGLLTWAVAMLIRFTTRPALGNSEPEDDEGAPGAEG